MGTEDVDDLLRWYLEVQVPMDAMTKADCEKKHDVLDENVEKTIQSATGRSESRLKLWLLGGLLAAMAAGLGGYTCTVSEVGAYRERIDNATEQIKELKQESARQVEELKQELKEMRIEIRQLLLRKEGP